MADDIKEEKTAGRLRHEAAVAICLIAAIVAIWRGLWGLMDLFLFQDNQVLSYFASIVIGLVILSTAHYGLRQVHLI